MALKDVVKKITRGRYKKKECPYCGKMVGNLVNHVSAAHSTEAVKPEPKTLSKEDLLLAGTHKKEPEATLGDTVFACSGCKAELRKGEVSCWNCGETLVWEGIE